MDDLKKEDGQTRYDIIHDDNVRQGSTKRKLLDQVRTYACHVNNLWVLVAPPLTIDRTLGFNN